jgi:hypothetical protein
MKVAVASIGRRQGGRMEFLSLAEAWRWIQVGFCTAVGASVIILGILGALLGSSSGDEPDPSLLQMLSSPR